MTANDPVVWAYAGLMLGLAAYNALIYLRTREKVFLWYWLFMPSLALLVMTLNGVSQQVLWPDLATVSLKFIPFAVSLPMALGGLFFIEFLKTRELHPLAHRLTLVGLAAQCVAGLGGIFLAYHQAILASIVAAAAYCLMGAVISLLCSLAGQKVARRYLISWLPLLIGVVVQVLAVADYLPLNILTMNSTLAGSALQAILLSLAMADRMQDLKEEKDAALRQLMQQEKMASLGMLSAGVAHEINNPNNFIRVGVGNLSAKVDDLRQFIEDSLDDESDEIRDIFRSRFAAIDTQTAIVREGTERIDTIVRGMRAGSRGDDAQPVVIQPVAGLRATVELVRSTWKTVADFDLSGLSADAPVKGFASQLNQVFTNLLVNACHAIEERQRLGGTQRQGLVRVSSRLEGSTLQIAIADDGCGMSEAVRQRLFQPFFTTKPADRGTGLGMGICKKIVEEHDGRIGVESREGVGTTMTIHLPVCNDV